MQPADGVHSGENGRMARYPPNVEPPYRQEQTIMIGPKALPIHDVPSGWIAKGATRIATATGAHRLKGRRYDIEPLQRGKHPDGGGDRSVAIDWRRSEGPMTTIAGR